MRLIPTFGLACLAALAVSPTIAMEATPGMMQSNSAMAMMPDGHMGSMMMTDEAMASKMKGMASAAKGCMMVMTDKNGKVSMIDTSSAEAKAECEKLAMLTPTKTTGDAAMAKPGMMAVDTVMAMMPDGHMGSMMADGAVATKMMGMATPATGCMMMMSDKDGKMSMIDTSSADAKAECEKLAMTAPAM